MRWILFALFYFGKMWKNMEKRPFFRAATAGLGSKGLNLGMTPIGSSLKNYHILYITKYPIINPVYRYNLHARKHISSSQFLNIDISLNSQCLRFSVCIVETHKEGTVSKMCCICLSFCFVTYIEQIFVKGFCHTI